MIGNVVLFGGGKLLVRLATELRNTGRQVDVVSSPRHMAEPLDASGKTFAAFLEEHRIQPIVSVNAPADPDVLGRVGPGTLGLSLGAAWILRKPFIDRFSGRLYNFHGARLPQFRGGGGFSWQILSGSRLGYALIHRIDEGIDTGPVMFLREFVFPTRCRVPLDFYAALEDHYAHIFPEFLELADDDRLTPLGQTEHLSTYWPRLSTPHQAFLDWSWTAGEIERFICAFDDPYAGAATFLGPRRLRLKACVVEPGDGTFHPFQAGLVYRKSALGVFIAARGGGLLVQRVLDEGTSAMADVRLGDRFHTGPETLAAAMSYRAAYLPTGLKQS